MPTQGILMHIPDQENVKNKISLHTLLKIEQTYSCSRSALLFRLINMNLLSLEMAENFRKNVIQKASQLGRSLDLYQPGNSGKMIGLYGSMARQLFEEQKISEGHYYELMNEAGLRSEEETDEIWQH
jgi:Zn-dependent peptidase ImmA (M78 family)